MKEFDLLKIFKTAQSSRSDLILGIGDDCAVLKKNDKEHCLISTDTLVQNVHFDATMTFEKIGRKIAAVSLSDIASMGGTPEFMLISLTLLKGMTQSDVAQIYAGVSSVNKLWNVSVVGGDTVSSKTFSITSTIWGRVKVDNIVYRSGARAGDWICVTGSIGGSLKEKHYNFKPRVDEAQWLVQRHVPSAMIDLSDGLAGDLRHILSNSSRRGAVLFPNSIPTHKDCATTDQNKRLHHSICDGEDFELLFTCNPSKCQILTQAPFFCSLIGYLDDNVDGLIWRFPEGDKTIRERGYEHKTC